MSGKRGHSPPTKTSQVFKSSPIKDRSSTFIAVFSPTYSAQALQSLPEYRTATHRMTAWRRPGKQQQLSLNSQEQPRPVFETGYDDDGESYGGKTLEKLLREGSAEGAIMVARWYGGVMLGPVRFEHIRNCAKEALERAKGEGLEGNGGEEEEGRAGKRVKETDDEERQKLIGILEERDLSIGILRGLLAEKRKELEKESSPTERASMVSSPSKGASYATMQLEVLKRLEQVRDKTIGWVLAQIEEVEKAQLEESKRLLLGAITNDGGLDSEVPVNVSAEREDGASKRDCGAIGERSLEIELENGTTVKRD